jgi:tetratricopeptide (TPR) repeat protein
MNGGRSTHSLALHRQVFEEAMDDNATPSADPASKPDFDVTAQRLATALNIARGGMSFIFVICNSVPLRDRVLARLAPVLEDALTVKLASPTDDALDLAVKAAGDRHPPVVVVTNLDEALLSPEHGAAALTALNASREIWWNRFACPVVFFVSDASLDRIVQAAPDLWSRKSHVFAFAEDGGQSIATPAMQMSSNAQDIATWPQARRTARLVELQVRLANLATDDSPQSHKEQARLLHECGDLRMALGHLPQAGEAFAEAASHAAQAADWSKYAFSQEWAAFVRKELGDYSAATAMVQEALDRLSALEMPGDVRVSGLYNALALIQLGQGDLPAARMNIERSIETNDRRFAPDHWTASTRHANLALIKRAQRDLPGARASQERAMAIHAKHFAPDHPSFAIRYANLALIQQDEGDLPGARASMERAIAIDEKYLAPNHPTLATRYNNLAYVAIAEGNIPEAVSLWRKAYLIRVHAFGPENRATKAVAAMLRKYDPPGP